MLPMQGDIESIVYGLLVGGGGAKIKSVQRGQTSLPLGSRYATVSIAEVDMSKTFVLVSLNTAGTNSAEIMTTARLSGPTQVRFDRTEGDTEDLTLWWTVVEFADGVMVQHLYHHASMYGSPVQISPVDTGKAFILHTHSASASSNITNLVSRVFIAVVFVDSDMVAIEIQGYWPEYVNIQIVEVTG